MVMHLAHFPENGATTCVSIFMASSTARRSPICDRVARLHGNRTTTAGAGRMDHAAFIAIDPMRNAIHFDPITAALHDGDDVETLVKAGEPILERAQAIDVGIDAGSI